MDGLGKAIFLEAYENGMEKGTANVIAVLKDYKSGVTDLNALIALHPAKTELVKKIYSILVD